MKSRLKLWTYMLGLAGGLWLVIQIFGWLRIEVEEVPIYFNVNTVNQQTAFRDALHGLPSEIVDNKKIVLRSTNNIDRGYSIWIDDYATQAVDGKALRYERFYTSPIVLFTPNYAAETDSGFSIRNPGDSQSSRFVEKDLRIILNAILDDLEWSDIGVGKVFNGNVSLIIPNESNFYYDYVIATIYYALNDYNDLTFGDVNRLRSKVETIVGRCDRVENIANYIHNMRLNRNKNSKPVLGPEFIIHSIIDDFSTNTSWYWIPTYFPKNIEIAYDLCIDGSLDIEVVEEIVDLLSSRYIFVTLGLRTVRPPYNLNQQSGFKHAIGTLDTYSLTVEELNALSVSTVVNSVGMTIIDFDTDEEEEVIEEEGRDEGGDGAEGGGGGSLGLVSLVTLIVFIMVSVAYRHYKQNSSRKSRK